MAGLRNTVPAIVSNIDDNQSAEQQQLKMFKEEI